MTNIVYLCENTEHAVTLCDKHLDEFAEKGVVTIPMMKRTGFSIKGETRIYLALVNDLDDDTARQHIQKYLPRGAFRTVYRVPIGDIPLWLYDECEYRTPRR